MTKIDNVIELNGTRYDARTGAMLGAESHSPKLTRSTGIKSATALHQRGNGRVMDGVVRMHKSPATAKTLPSMNMHVRLEPAVRREQHHAQHHAPHSSTPLVAHQPQHSKTLMRHSVKKPDIQPKKIERAQSPVDSILVKVKPSALAVKPKLSSDQIDVRRAERALEIPRSDKVARFQHNQNQQHYEAFAPADHRAQDIELSHHQRSAARQQPRHDMFEQAIANASSHEEPAPHEAVNHKARRGVRRHMRAVSISAAVVAMLVLGGFVAYQNKVQLQLQLASARAGFPASMPGYKPSGYAARNLSYGPGTVTIGFLGNGKSFSLVQKSSNWDSETLLQNYVSDLSPSYQAYQAAGRTVYIYGNHNATWVSGGVWYQVKGNADLSNNQIVSLASSM